jgi:hypothetical protein
VQVPRSTIVDLLRSRGQDGLAAQAEQHLPEQVDTRQLAETLQRLGIDVPALLSRLPGPLRSFLER